MKAMSHLSDEAWWQKRLSIGVRRDMEMARMKQERQAARRFCFGDGNQRHRQDVTSYSDLGRCRYHDYFLAARAHLAAQF